MSQARIMEKLVKNLRLFGLNPKQWMLIPGGGSEWYIVNKNNRSLKIKGVSSLKDRRTPYWKQIDWLNFR